MKQRILKNRKKKGFTKFFFVIIFAVFLSISAYSYAVASTTFSAHDLEEKKNKIFEMQNELHQLEQDYFKLYRENMSEENIAALGLEKSHQISYVKIS